MKLPLLPTTTVGSFPQTSEMRKARADFRKKKEMEMVDKNLSKIDKIIQKRIKKTQK